MVQTISTLFPWFRKTPSRGADSRLRHADSDWSTLQERWSIDATRNFPRLKKSARLANFLIILLIRSFSFQSSIDSDWNHRSFSFEPPQLHNSRGDEAAVVLKSRNSFRLIGASDREVAQADHVPRQLASCRVFIFRKILPILLVNIPSIPCDASHGNKLLRLTRFP